MTSNIESFIDYETGEDVSLECGSPEKLEPAIKPLTKPRRNKQRN
jgi:hypothetical protein